MEFLKTNEINTHTLLKNGEMNERIKEQIQEVNEFEGCWIGNKEIRQTISSFYIGENYITNLYEGYLTVNFLDSIDKCLPGVIKTLDFLKKHNLTRNLDILYLQIHPLGISWNLKLIEYISLILGIEDRWEIGSYFIEKQLSSNYSSPDESNQKKLDIRLKTEMDRNVLNCLIDAYYQGIHPKLREQVVIDKIGGNVNLYYKLQNTKNLLITYCEIDGDFCGHATYEILQNNKAQLVDLYIMENYREKGIGRLLSYHGEMFCKMRGATSVIGTVENWTSNSILENLIKSGWDISSVIFCKV